jgi:hypothetical protein
VTGSIGIHLDITDQNQEESSITIKKIVVTDEGR